MRPRPTISESLPGAECHHRCGLPGRVSGVPRVHAAILAQGGGRQGGGTRWARQACLQLGFWPDGSSPTLLLPHTNRQRPNSGASLTPPPFPKSVLGKMFGWLVPVFATSDVWLLHAAGLDALVLLKTTALCIQILLPFCVIGCGLRESVWRGRRAGRLVSIVVTGVASPTSAPPAPPPSPLPPVMPLQIAEGVDRGDTTFSRLTMANVPTGSAVMWAHL
jgi:hypothetical protein